MYDGCSGRKGPWCGTIRLNWILFICFQTFQDLVVRHDFINLFVASNLDPEPDMIRVGCGVKLGQGRKMRPISSSSVVRTIVLFAFEAPIAGNRLCDLDFESAGGFDVSPSDGTSLCFGSVMDVAVQISDQEMILLVSEVSTLYVIACPTC